MRSGRSSLRAPLRCELPYCCALPQLFVLTGEPVLCVSCFFGNRTELAFATRAFADEIGCFLLQELSGKAAGKKQQKQPQKGGSGDGRAAAQNSANQPVAAQPGSEVAYPADKSKDETGAAQVSSAVAFSEAVGQKDAVGGTGSGSGGGGGSTGSGDVASAAAGKLPGGVPVTTALKSGISRLQVSPAVSRTAPDTQLLTQTLQCGFPLQPPHACRLRLALHLVSSGNQLTCRRRSTFSRWRARWCWARCGVWRCACGGAGCSYLAVAAQPALPAVAFRPETLAGCRAGRHLVCSRRCVLQLKFCRACWKQKSCLGVGHACWSSL